MAFTPIPMPLSPGEAFQKGFGYNDNLMKQILERNQLAELKKYHQGDLDIRQAAGARAAQAAADAHRKALHDLDPLSKARDWEALENYWKNKYMPNANTEQMPVPNQEPVQGQDESNQQGLTEAQRQVIAQQPVPHLPGGVTTQDLELMKKFPAMRELYKSIWKIDPLAPVPQTPEEKEASQLDLFNKKEAIKKQNKAASGEILTDKIKSKYQNVIGGAASAKPILRKLIQAVKKGEIPGQMIGALFKRDAQASYKGEISTLLDGIRNAYTIPNTDSGTQKAEDKVLRKNGESDANYAKRLQGILDQIEDREKDATIKLSAGNITAGKTVHLIGPNGEDYDVPESEVDAILQENPGVRRG